MDSTKYIGMDVHKETVSIAVMNSAGKVVTESIIETKAATILQFIQGLRGTLQVTFEEGTWAAWLYDLLKPQVTKIVVCDPRRNALLKEGNKGDKVDARRAEFFYQQLDALQVLRQQVRRDLLAESRKHSERKLLRQIPSIGPIRAALLMALIQTPHRFRTKRQLWAYSGLAIETHDSAQYRYVAGQLQRSKKPQQLRGLNQNHNHDLKAIFKGAAAKARSGAGPFHDFYEALLTKGMRPSMARLTLARKIAAITLIVWKKGAHFDAEQLKPQAA
jgi:hypothetical protein